MDKANVIISIIIVLCIAAAVAAYGLTNSDNPIFSQLSGMSSKDTGTGVGNHTAVHNGSSSSHGSSSSSSGSGSGSSSSGSSSGSSSSGSSSGSSSSGGSNSGGSNSGGSGTHLSYGQAQSIASGAIEVAGCYAGSGYYSGGYWYFPIYDSNGTQVDTISVEDASGMTGRG